ncbi:FAD-binding oxidoreductase [Telmatocola sphagniphila]|uniref:FAD-binding oxidoreductase n=1 Tax=Telmatocola sphagniphila TaxID=1123043 RepID=A0A8E6B822_9BACT|nr:FAD-binding oxidoreductase [Telmatocola sphagniphila]QVL33466.1 FAD-binding oxidoreductase [Telmatocola sphagniphila]
MVTLNSQETCSIDSFGPLPRWAPHSPRQLGELVTEAAGEGKALYPVGGRTQLSLGHTPQKLGYAVSTLGLDHLEDYPARDMTITVGAGITLANLQAILAKENQKLPVDIPLPDKATLGGAIATNASGQRRFGLGTLRDYIIGIQSVNDQGQIVQAGGRVVKNVAGYDFMKLYTGSLGTLAIITQVTLKLKPIPEASQWVLIPSTLLDIPQLLERLRVTKTRPVAIELFNHLAVNSVSSAERFDEIHRPMAVLFEDNAPAVSWQIEQLKKELPASLASKMLSLSKDQMVTLDNGIRDFPLANTAKLRFKVMVRPSDLWLAFQELSTLNPRPLLNAHAGNGIIHGSFDSSLGEEAGKLVLARLTKLAEQTQGNFVITDCPKSWKSNMAIWGRSTSDRAMMKIVKQKLDPGSIFNPGRFVDGI